MCLTTECTCSFCLPNNYNPVQLYNTIHNVSTFRQGVDSKRLAVVQEYREHIEKELQEICGDVLTVLESHLLPHASSHESHVFYCKM